VALHDWAILALVVAAAGTDIRWRRIPNGLTVPFAVAGLFFNALAGGPAEGLRGSIAGLALGLLIPGVLFALGGMGGGDVKLLASIGSWVGPNRMLSILALGALVGGLMSLFALTCSRKSGDVRRIGRDATLLLLSRTRVEPSKDARTLPYSLPVALGVVLNILFGDLW
jgi:prepilin peptidase CpaA